MTNRSAGVLGCVAFITVFSAWYLLSLYHKFPMPKYYPLEHTWSTAKIGTSPAMAWYSIQGSSFLIAALIGGAVYYIIKKRPVAFSPAVEKILCIVPVLVLLAAFILLYKHEF